MVEWIALIVAGAGGAFVLGRLAVPAPWLIAPLVVALAASAGGLVELRVPPWVFDLLAFGETLAVAALGAWGALRLKVPAGALLGPMVLGAVLHGTGIVRIAVPAFVLDAAYVAIGLAIGLLYTRATVRYALRVLPQLVASTVVLIALCCGSAALLVVTLDVDALTAYLATTPGGLDSVTVIALNSGANVPLVLAVQALRIVVVILTGPAIAKLIARSA